jgi:amidase
VRAFIVVAARIEADNINGLGLRAVIETAPRDNGESAAKVGGWSSIRCVVLAIARQLDEDRAAGRIRGQLHGVPILIK